MTNARHRGLDRTVAVAALLLLASPLSAGSVLYVDDDAAPGGDGTTWKTAFRFLQDALAEVAGPGDVITAIHVAQGVYTPDRNEAIPGGTGDRAATFGLVSEIALRGGYAGIGAPDPGARDIAANPTILSGDLFGDDDRDFACNEENSHHVVSGGGVDSTAVLDGFTVAGGNASGALVERGGGIYVEQGSPTVMDCTITANFAHLGGGMYNSASATTITGCLFRGNRADEQETGAGGGMCNANGGTVTVSTCIFEGNRVFAAPFFLTGNGGAMANLGSTPNVANCRFTGNGATGSGGAIFNDEASPHIVSCDFTKNRSDLLGESGGSGGAIYSDGFFETLELELTGCRFVANDFRAVATALTNVVITNCLFAQNESAAASGYFSDIVMTNCTVVGHSFSGLLAEAGVIDIVNCLFWSNGAFEIATLNSVVTVRYSNIEGGWDGDGEGNRDLEPRFAADPSSGPPELSLAAGSPCIDAGSTPSVPLDLTFDIDGNLRHHDDPGRPNTGEPDDLGGRPPVDIGAYEFQGTTPPRRFACPWDTNETGFVGFLDLLDLLAHWGPCGG